MRLLIAIIITFISFKSVAQSKTVNLTNKSFSLDSLLNIKKDTLKYITLLYSLNIKEIFVSDLTIAVFVFTTLKKEKEALIFAKYAIEKGKNIELLSYYLSKENYKNLKLSECEFNEKYKSTIPIGLYFPINNMYRTQMYIRKLNIESKLPEIILKAADTSYVEELKELITKYGFISEKKHGDLFYQFYFVASECFLNSNENYSYFSKYLREEVLNRNIKPEFYAYFVDRYFYYVLKKGYQIYGSLGDSFIGFPIVQNLKTIDNLRSKIGACSLRNWFLTRKIPLKYLPNEYGK